MLKGCQTMETVAVPSDNPYTGNRQFHGVYLLYCLNPARQGKTYIGYTVNPKRRIKQHNIGTSAGGAAKTSGKGPWDMVLIVHGFPTEVAGLRFEWAWQHPNSSRRLKHVQKKKSREKAFDAKLRILSEMLSTGPWNRLPLTVQWLKQEYVREFPITSQPPIHMPIAYGPINVDEKKSTNKALSPVKISDNDKKCQLCDKVDEDVEETILVECCDSKCTFKSHAVCFAKQNRGTKQESFLIPISVECPKCGVESLWGNLIYGKKHGAELDGENDNHVVDCLEDNNTTGSEKG